MKSLSLGEPIIELMRQVDGEFLPPLSSKVDLDAYVDKIIGNALIFQVLENASFAGFIAVYCNDPTFETAFITMVAVSQAARGKGLAASLVRAVIEHCRRAGYNKLALEAYKSNTAAIKLYEKLGFSVVHEGDASLLLEIRLQ